MSEWWMEKVMEEFETQCYDAIKTAEGLGMEYDEDTVCDVCRSVSQAIRDCRQWFSHYKFYNNIHSKSQMAY